MSEPIRLFLDLPVPPGGLERLQRRLAADHRTARRHVRWLPAGAAFASGVLLLAILLPGAITRQRQTDQLTAALHAAIAPPPGGIRVVDGAALELPSGDPAVRLYLVQAASAAAD
ncbi:hypothetical protein I6J77_02645 [Rhodanobacter sp. FDAARGOS 1247]|uniref:hypothetical protein n=1 Tax=Rhodanobacter sp. FDAARGOS 1247 TaxID=2778082 RepID=UPI001950B2C6|nr:hypothetical protein [Rhodanobacter sp. FDAARGOS 1247]QRP64380.1 hypothetical protein I6J77_02645 [Rhodanobacter sp. FDAARGOS 1247]